ncbi:MAG: hypothetical protein Q8M02_13215 [Candidatus Didemnitutus sp.]|nr:hypothetical protein [Candidatus Didemnitutus sp.]
MELRHTDTNSADDSRGRVFGLDGNLYLPVVIAAVVGLGLLAVCGVGLRTGWTVAGVIAGIPLAITLAWAVLLKNGRPPAYDRDWVEQYLGGGDFSRSAGQQRGLLDG